MEIYSTKVDFDKFGFAGPFLLGDKNLALRLQRAYPEISDRPHGRHRDVKAVQEVLYDHNLQSKLYKLCSRNLVLWRTNFFVKIPGSQEIGWHHDKHFQSNDVEEIDFNEINSHFSICLALHDMNSMNGGLEVIPGSHVELPGYRRDRRPYYSRPAADHFADIVPEKYLETRRLITLKAGEFLIFHSALMHRSLPYVSGSPRVSFVSRYIDKKVSIPGQLKSKLSLIEFNASNQV